MTHELPDDVRVNTIESFFEVDKVCVQWSVPFCRLFDYYPQGCNMVSVGFVFPKPCLLTAQFVV